MFDLGKKFNSSASIFNLAFNDPETNFAAISISSPVSEQY